MLIIRTKFYQIEAKQWRKIMIQLSKLIIIQVGHPYRILIIDGSGSGKT